MSWNRIRNRGQVIKPASTLCSALICRNIRERAPDKAPRATAKSAARLSGRALAVRRASRHGYSLASRISETDGAVATANLPLTGRSSCTEKPTDRKALSVATPLTSGPLRRDETFGKAEGKTKHKQEKLFRGGA